MKISGKKLEVIKSITDLRGVVFDEPIIHIYDKPKEYPDKFVAHIYDGKKPTEYIMLADCFWLLEFDIEKHTKLKFYVSLKEDSDLFGMYK